MIQREYEAGRRAISEIVAENNLQEIIEGNPYFGYFTGGGIWVLIAKSDSVYKVYSGGRAWTAEIKTMTYDLSNEALSSLFVWAESLHSVKYTVHDNVYNPFYYYFVLFDEGHNVSLEFNINTENASKKAQVSRRIRRTMPFTKAQQRLIWEIIGVG
ncbi:MAG: hypothetical protein LBR65_03520 [Culturomica sp.]|nr:hypothetical protein [Culturomica sp.]